MSASFNSFLRTVPHGNGSTNVRILFYTAKRGDIVVDHVGTSRAPAWLNENNGVGRYGINGMFYIPNSNPLSTVAFAVNGGSLVTSSRNENWEHRNTGGTLVRPFSCLVSLSQSVNGRAFGTGVCKGSFPFTIDNDNITQSNAQWCVGGINLYCSDTSITNQTQLMAKVKADVDAQTPNVNDRVINGYNATMNGVARTAVGYRFGGDVVLAAFFNEDNRTSREIPGLTHFELRRLMRNELNCTMGVSLDGGGSTQISYITSGGIKSSQVISPNNIAVTRVRIADGVNIQWHWGGVI
jgi:hypothetical protein